MTAASAVPGPPGSETGCGRPSRRPAIRKMAWGLAGFGVLVLGGLIAAGLVIDLVP